jgi:kynureninase
MESLRSKSIRLTAYLEQLLLTELPELVTIFTPSDPNQRGCQLSLTVRLLPSTREDVHNSSLQEARSGNARIGLQNCK